MEHLYLKQVDLDDIDLLIEYNNDFRKHYPNKNFSINENTFNDWYNELKKTRESENSMHIIPFWFMKDEKPIGLPIIKTNIEANEEYNKYGGHISYVIAPSYRKKGYGTICCHLAIEKCKEYGLKEVTIHCDDRNIGSSKIIENNYGVLKDVYIYNGEEKSFIGRFHRRYIIDIEESLKKYDEKCHITKSTLKEICNLNRDNLEDFLINNMQSEVKEETLRLSRIFNSINDIKDILNLYQTFMQEFIIDENSKIDKVARLTEEIVESRICSSSNDVGLVLSTLLRLKGIPTIFVSTLHIDWIKQMQKESQHSQEVQGYVFLEIYLNNKWYLFDSMKGKIYDNYDYNNLSLPDGYYAFRKTLNNCNFGAFSSKEIRRIMCETFENFDLKKYKDPNYMIIEKSFRK